MDNQFKPANHKTKTNTSNENLIHPNSSPGSYEPPAPLSQSKPPIASMQPVQQRRPESVAGTNLGDITEQLPSAEAPLRHDEQPAKSVSSPADSSKPKKKKSKKLLFAMVAFLLALGGSALAYFFVYSKSKPASQPVATVPAPKEAVPIAENGLFFQTGQKIIKYDAKKKEKIVLSDKLPANTEVIDFYAEGDAWRAYAQTNSGEEVKIYYLESGKDPQKVYAKKRFIVSAANAKTQQVAITEVFDASNDPGAVGANKHLLIKKNGVIEQLVESESQSAARGLGPENNIKQLNWGVYDIAPNGTKILFRYAKWYSDDPGNGILEYDIATKKSRLVAKEGRGNYDSSEKIIVEKSNTGGLGWLDAQTPTQLSLDKEVEPGKFENTLEISNTNWASVVYQRPAGLYFTVYTRGPQYSQDGSSMFEGIYQIVNPKEFKKIDIKNLPTDNYNVSEIGPKVRQSELQCFGVLLIDKKSAVSSEEPAQYRFGKVCIDKEDISTYEEMDTTTVPAGSTQTMKFL